MLTARVPDSLAGWVQRLVSARIPVLRHSVDALARLMEREDEVLARNLSEVILCDPLLTLTVLRYLQSHRPNRRIADVTTIEHAIMMMGISPFFRQFRNLPVAEDLLAGNAMALRGFMDVTARARHAAIHARSWATIRSDIESEEVVVAALLHDMAEMLLWFFAPQLVARIGERMRTDPALRGSLVQQEVLGFKLADLQLALSRAWKLPDLLQSLMDDEQAHRPRARNVLLAVALARHSAHGWFDAALPGDVSGIRDLLGQTTNETRQLIYATEIAAVEDSERHATGMPAVWLPPPPMFVEAPPDGMTPVPHAVDLRIVDFVTEHIAESLARRQSGSNGQQRNPLANCHMTRLDLIAHVLHGLKAGFGLDRVIYFECDADSTRLIARYLMGGREASGLREVAIHHANWTEFLAVLYGMESLAESRTLLKAHLPEILCRPGTARQFLAAPVRSGHPDNHWALVHAEGTLGLACLDEAAFAQFHSLLRAAEGLLASLGGCVDV